MAITHSQRDQYVAACMLKAKTEAQLFIESHQEKASKEKPLETNEPPDTWLSTEEAAKHMKIATRTVSDWVNSGRLISHGSGKCRRFKKSACDRALRQDRK